MLASGAAAARARMLAALALCERELDRRNAHVAGTMALGFERLRALLRTGRLARVAAIGRRGAGKSSLLNAIEGRERAPVGDVEDATRRLACFPVAWGEAHRAVEWIDTPGLRAGGRPERRDEVANALAMAPPDALLVLCQASEVDAGIDDDLADLAVIVRRIAHATPHRRPPVVFGVVTKVDELAPADVAEPPFDDPDKLANIRRAVGLYASHLRRAGVAAAGVLPVVTYVGYAAGGAVAHDLRWNVPTLVARVAQALPDDDALAGTLARDELRATLARVAGDVTDAFAELAARVARGATGLATADRGAELAALGRLHVQLLENLSPSGRAFADKHFALAVSRPDGALEALRAGIASLGGARISGALAASRVHSTGALLVPALLADTEADAAREIASPRRE